MHLRSEHTQNTITGMKKRFLLIGLAFGLFILLTRAVYQLPFLYSWDGVQYALSINDFDIHKHQPQPPGNPLYSISIRAFTLLTQDPNKAMIVLNVLATFAATYLIGITAWLAGRRFAPSKRTWVAIGAAALFCSNPVVWF